jgi:hypothetical protein
MHSVRSDCIMTRSRPGLGEKVRTFPANVLMPLYFSYPRDFLAAQLRPFNIQLVSQSSVHGVSENDGQAQTPDQCDGVEEVGIARTGVDPEMVKGRTQNSGV